MVCKEVCRCRNCGFELRYGGFTYHPKFQITYRGIPIHYCPECGAMDSFIISSEPAEPVKESEISAKKPVVYLYPTEETEVSVKLTLNVTLTCTYPSYEDGWHVIARPDGTLTNLSDKKEYSYLYWEGVSQAEWDMSRGFVVQGKDTAEFLQGILQQIGLTPREYNEFIVYWLPKMQDHAYNLITFQQERYTQSA
ncbi:MAG: hypothetical protein LUG91_07685 [Ruminococcus sp.]|nr:hypothetical protein [Ruminococcus sp.]